MSAGVSQLQPESAPVADATPASERLRLRLQAELVRRCQANPRYSLRAFARALEIDGSVLSKILAGKRTVGPRAARKLVARLSLSPGESAQLLDALAGLPSSAPDAYRSLAADSFEIVSDWYHFAILELLRVEGFRPDIKWVARCLGISLAEAQAAVERLQRVGMLEIRDAKGKAPRWIHVSAPQATVIAPGVTSAAHRKLQRQILEKSILALEEVPLELRSHTAMTMAIDPAKLDEARERIRKFRRSLSRFLSRGAPCTEVYHLGLCLYPVTHKPERKSSP